MNYIKALTTEYPEVHFTLTGDPSVYGNIQFHGQIISESSLTGVWLDIYKQDKLREINKRTQELCLGGFTWNGVEFSTSETAQRNWMAMYQFQSLISFPKVISTKDDGSYSIDTAVEAQNFVAYCLGTIEARYNSGITLRDQIKSATTVEEVDAVEDNR